MKRTLKIIGVTFVTLFLLLYFGPYLFPDTISKESKELSFEVNLSSLFSAQIKVDKIFLDESFINIKVNKQGNQAFICAFNKLTEALFDEAQSGQRASKRSHKL